MSFPNQTVTIDTESDDGSYAERIGWQQACDTANLYQLRQRVFLNGIRHRDNSGRGE